MPRPGILLPLSCSSSSAFLGCISGRCSSGWLRKTPLHGRRHHAHSAGCRARPDSPDNPGLPALLRHLQTEQGSDHPHVHFLFLALVSLVGWFLHKNMREEKFRRLYRWVLTWVMIGFGVYFLCIVYSYVTTFPYDESVRAASMFRYYSIYAAFTLPIFLMPYVRPRERFSRPRPRRMVKKGKWIKRTALAMLVFLLCNLNGSFYLLRQSFKQRPDSGL